MKRRSALQFGGATLAGFLGGCSAFERSTPSTVTVSEITIRNRLDRDIEASVLLVDDGEVAYWRSVSVPAGSNPFATLTDLPETAGAYDLYAHVPASENDPPVQANLVEAAGDRSCITVGMEVTTASVDGEDVPAVAYGTIGEC
ncbi:hypothetical protein [Natronomonas amylolytica]|uniref:hypothetical protein n=1 Tax=Natronomonas amylolytica TaxID=3108498 RepID=UPI00300A7E37